MDRVTFLDTPLSGLRILATSPIQDERGRFVRVFCDDEFARIRKGLHWNQVNLSKTHGQGAVRGMHFQHPPAA